MLIAPTLLSFITTYRCTAACDHCCYSCSPRRRGTIPFRRMVNLVDDAVHIPTIRTIGFTGGECFLLGKKLGEAIGIATDRGFNTRCVSNGYWAKTGDMARRRISELAVAGLGELTISTGTFHSAYIPVDRAINAACAGAEAGLKTLVNVETYAESDFDIDGFLTDRRIFRLVAEKKLEVRRILWIPGNGTSRVSQPWEYSRFRGPDAGGCKYCLNYITVNPELDVLACCGLRAGSIPGMMLGSLASARLYEVLENGADDLMKMWIRVEGPENILKFVKRRVPEYSLPLRAVHPCESCEHLYHDPKAKVVLEDHYHEVEKNITDRYIAEMTAG